MENLSVALVVVVSHLSVAEVRWKGMGQDGS